MRGESIELDYIIANSSNNVYIKLNENGSPITCSKQDAQHFESSKARNILDNLPKTMKKFHFKVIGIPDITIKEKESETKVIQKENYVLSDNVKRWIDKFKVCDDIVAEAKERKVELQIELSNIDKEFSNLVHKIEFEEKIDLYGGWIERNQIKENREKRRDIKDELLIVSNVLKTDFTYMSSENIRKSVEGLANRKFTLRVVEEGENDGL